MRFDIYVSFILKNCADSEKDDLRKYSDLERILKTTIFPNSAKYLLGKYCLLVLLFIILYFFLLPNDLKTWAIRMESVNRVITLQ